MLCEDHSGVEGARALPHEARSIDVERNVGLVTDVEEYRVGLACSILSTTEEVPLLECCRAWSEVIDRLLDPVSRTIGTARAPHELWKGVDWVRHRALQGKHRRRQTSRQANKGNRSVHPPDYNCICRACLTPGLLKAKTPSDGPPRFGFLFLWGLRRLSCEKSPLG